MRVFLLRCAYGSNLLYQIVTSGQVIRRIRPHRRRTWTVQFISLQCAPDLLMLSCTHPNPSNPNGISICSAVLQWQIDRQTDRPRYTPSLTIGRIHVCSAAMRPNNWPRWWLHIVIPSLQFAVFCIAVTHSVTIGKLICFFLSSEPSAASKCAN